jgi:hypothetical protein
LEDLVTDVIIIFKWITKKHVGKMWNELTIENNKRERASEERIHSMECSYIYSPDYDVLTVFH